MKKHSIIIIIIIIIIILILALIVLSIGTWEFIKIGNAFWTTERQIKASLSDTTQTFRIDIDEEAEFPHSIDLKFKGKIDGQGILTYGWSDSTFYMIDTITNEFDFEYRTDWYTDWCLITYKPLTATKGNLQIHCEIYSGRK